MFITFVTALAVLAFLMSTMLNRVMIRVAHSIGLLDQPRSAVSQPSIPLGGGLVAFIVVVGVSILVLPFVHERSYVLLGLAALIQLTISLVDDVRRGGLNYYFRLAVELALGCAIAMYGIRLQLPYGVMLSVPVTALWIALVTNCFNLLDNMDGLCGSTSLVTGFFLSCATVIDGSHAAFFSAALVGTAAGFLTVNWKPARIYLGDVGSNFFGLVLSGLFVIYATDTERTWITTLTMAVCFFAIPLYDTSSVFLLRIAQGRNPFLPDAQHISHRFVRLGWSVPRTVLTINALSVYFGSIGLIPVVFGERCTGITGALWAVSIVGLIIVERAFSSRRMVGKLEKVLILTMYYEPEPNIITADVARHLGKTAAVTVITGHPNYPFGRFYAGTRYWRPVKSEENDRLTVWRLPFMPYHGLSKVKRILSYLSFTVFAALWAPLVVEKPTIVWVYQTPFSVALAALWFRFVSGAKLVFSYADLWPESLLAAGLADRGFLVRLMFGYRRWINRAADAIVCSTHGMVKIFRTEGVSPARLSFIPVWVQGIPEKINQKVTVVDSEESCAEIVYMGNLGVSQNLDILVLAAEILQQRKVPLRFSIYGTGTEDSRLRQMIASRGIRNVVMQGRVTAEAAFELSSCATAQLVMLKPTPWFVCTVPSKLTACFAAGTPLLCGLEGEAAEMCRVSGAALMFDAKEASALANAAERLTALSREERQAMGKRARTYYQKHLSVERLLARYELIFRNVRRYSR